VNDRVEFVAEMKDKKYFVKEIRRNNWKSF
jgi:hypothetical protein